MVRRQKIIATRPATRVKTAKPIKQHHIDRHKPPHNRQSAKLLMAGSDKLPLYTSADKRTKIALIQTGSWGDNINSTLMFLPLKAKYPDSVIDVYTSTYYADAFYNNPHINHIIKYVANDKQESLHLTVTIPSAIEQRGYDHVFSPHPMFNPENWTSLKHGEIGVNLICAWIRALEHADIEYDWPLETSLRLTEAEIRRVAGFCKKIPNMRTKRNILMEVSGESGQSFWDHHWTIEVSKHLLSHAETNLFISRRNNSSDVADLQKHAPGRVFFVGDLTLRECAELFNRCQAFFSVSSGLSNACNTNWCKNDITWVEVTNSPTVTSAPIRKEGKIFWQQNDRDAFIAMLRDKGI